MRFPFASMLLLCLFTTLVAPAAEVKSLTIAVIPKGTTHEFWKAINAGAVKAERELTAAGTPVKIIWKGPLKEDDRTQQIDVVQGFTAKGVSGIVLAPLDAQALAAPVAQATAAGIPVVVIDSALNSDQQVSFVATNNRAGGKLAGERLLALLAGAAADRKKVILLRYQAGSASTEEREAGFLDALKDHPEIELLSSDQHAGATRESALTASQNLLSRFHGKVAGVFTPNESSTVGMMLALKEAGLSGPVKDGVKHVGFDASSALIDGLKSGAIHGLVVQDPFQMGYLGVTTLVAHLTGKKVEKQTDTPVQLVTLENLAEPAIAALLAPPLADYLGEKK